MKKRMSLCTELIVNLDPKIRDRILNINVGKDKLNKFREKEKKDIVRQLMDLREIKSKSESEVYEVLNTMVKNNQFFMYCGPLLININPGPNKVKDYLNLQSWVKETESKNESEWKPHLYSFMYFVYQTMVSEKKDQVVNMLGQIGAGKTFNLIHIIEYFCCMVGPENYQIETFDMIHRSIQLIHIMGSIFRQNNLESTSCGILLRLGFGDNNKICNFEMEAKILDCTLPFSENGRSYSILHSIMTAASAELKRNFNLPEQEIQLNFFRKFSKNFSQRTKDRFKLNDYEIWNRFHSLLKFFDFSKNEVIEILQIFAFILSLNELGMTKATQGKIEGFNINKGSCSKKIAKNFSCDEDEFIRVMGFFKEITDVKNTLISLMKYSYYIVFEYIQKKIKNKLHSFFNGIYSKSGRQSTSTLQNLTQKSGRSSLKLETSSSNRTVNLNIDQANIKYINFLDFPGEVDDQTLGGLITNVANECINLYAGNSYSSVVEKLVEEKLFLKLFKPLHSYQVVRAICGDKGFLSFLSLPFTEENYNNLRKEALKQNYFKKCIEFKDIESETSNNDFKVNVTFSHKAVQYNYESLYLETKSLINVAKAFKVFSISKNSIIRSTFQRVVDPKCDFFGFVNKSLIKLFGPIENLSPFVVYCLHSNNSFKLFFGNGEKETDSNWVIPRNLTRNMLKKSLCIPVLYWEWYGYHEWIEIDAFVKRFGEDFEKIDTYNKNKQKDVNDNTIHYNDLNNYEKANYMLSSLYFLKEAVVGKTLMLMKKGTLDRIANRIQKYLKIMQEEKNKKVQNVLNQNSKQMTKNITKKNSKATAKSNTSSKVSSKKDLSGKGTINSSQLNRDSITSNSPIERRMTMKQQCHVDLFDGKDDGNKLTQGHNPTCTKYNVYRILDRNTNDYLDSVGSIDIKEKEEEKKNGMDDKELAQFRKKNNIVVPDKNNFNMVQGLFDFNKNTNFNIFDYTTVEPDIIKIQAAYRGYKGRQKYLLLRYIMRQIILIQSKFKGVYTRSKFARLKRCLKCITLIQKTYKGHYNSLNKNATAIQTKFRQKLSSIKARRKLERYRQCLVSGEEYVDTSDEERQGEVNKRKIKIFNKKKGKKAGFKPYKPLAKGGSTNSKYDMSKLQDKDKIISAILLDGKLMKENEKMNRQLANARGVKKNVKYELLQIDPKSIDKKHRIEDKLIEYGEALRQKRAQEKVDKLKTQEMEYTFTPAIRKSKPSYLKNFSKDFYKRAQMFEERKSNRLEQIKTTIVDPEEGEYTYKPKLTKQAKNKKRTIEDLYNWKEKRDKHLEDRKKEKETKEKEELDRIQTMSHVNDMSKIILERKGRSNPSGSKLNKNSSMGDITGRRREYDLDDDEIQIDLWPKEIEKRYTEKPGESIASESGTKRKEKTDYDFEEEEEDVFN